MKAEKRRVRTLVAVLALPWLPSVLGASLWIFLSTGIQAGTVCRTVTVPVPYKNGAYSGVTNVPQTVCEEVPDPPSPQADPSQTDPAQRLRNVREVCELAKAAHGEELGQKYCQALIRAHNDCAGFTAPNTYSACLQASTSKNAPK